MKTAVLLLGGGVRQIMLYAENDAEEMAIKALVASEVEEMSVEFKEGGFYDGDIPKSARGLVVQQCQGGWQRAYDTPKDEGLMIVIRPKKEQSK